MKKKRPSIYSLLDSLFLSLPPARQTKFSLNLSKSMIGSEANLSYLTASERMKCKINIMKSKLNPFFKKIHYRITPNPKQSSILMKIDPTFPSWRYSLLELAFPSKCSHKTIVQNFPPVQYRQYQSRQTHELHIVTKLLRISGLDKFASNVLKSSIFLSGIVTSCSKTGCRRSPLL